MHRQVHVCDMFGQDRQNTNSEISSPFLQQQVSFLKYQIHFTKVIYIQWWCSNFFNIEQEHGGT
jgi:hypothetical protein